LSHLIEREAPWVVVGGLKEGDIGRCTRCGAVLRLALPMNLYAVALYMQAFVEEHRYCSTVT
jgi:hypothetical protein